MPAKSLGFFLALTGGMTVFTLIGLAETPNNTLYRTETPAVLERATEEPDHAKEQSLMATALFGKAYRDAGSPRIAVFWNRTFSDRLQDMESQFRVVHSLDHTKNTEGEDDTTQTTGKAELAATVEYRNEDSRLLPLSEIDEFKFEAGYSQPFLESGVSLIDRAAVMRLTHANNVREDPSRATDDRQFIETDALKAHADMLIQILMTPSAQSKLGTVFRVSVMDLKTGEMKVNFFGDDDMKGEKSEKWVAAQGGYIRVQEDRDINIKEMGNLLALQTMNEFLRIWQ